MAIIRISSHVLQVRNTNVNKSNQTVKFIRHTFACVYMCVPCVMWTLRKRLYPVWRECRNNRRRRHRHQNRRRHHLLISSARQIGNILFLILAYTFVCMRSTHTDTQTHQCITVGVVVVVVCFLRHFFPFPISPFGTFEIFYTNFPIRCGAVSVLCRTAPVWVSVCVNHCLRTFCSMSHLIAQIQRNISRNSNTFLHHIREIQSFSRAQRKEIYWIIEVHSVHSIFPFSLFVLLFIFARRQTWIRKVNQELVSILGAKLNENIEKNKKDK